MISGFFSPMRADGTLTVPMLSIGLGRNGQPGDPVQSLTDNVLALLDTGADVCYIDNELAEQHDLQECGTITAGNWQGVLYNRQSTKVS